MDEKLVISVANILEEWNPLGAKASAINDLNGYYTEAIDILSASLFFKQPIKRSVATVLSQAFGLSLDETQLNQYSKKIEQIVNEHSS